MHSQDQGQDCQRGPLPRRLSSPESIQSLQECTEKGCSSCQGLIDIIRQTKPWWLSEAQARDLCHRCTLEALGPFDCSKLQRRQTTYNCIDTSQMSRS
ncbi:hypothetical protein K456DRAFT_393181 [Colletotrichum gloeosporioides 23]|nr:hypothetical protein K456DRAFT_393181 [Colletotrichum gloeosporioides 23]